MIPIALSDGRAFLWTARARGAWAKARVRVPDEVAALRLGIELGMSLIDTAEMYGDGEAEDDFRRSDPRTTPRRLRSYESLSA